MPTIRFNTSTGSDTQASGSAGAIAAFGTNASFSGSTVTLDGSPDLSGFNAADDVLWLDTSTGRQFFALSGADNGAKTVTTTDAPAGTSSGLTWGIGGKRNSWDNADSRLLFTADVKAGWIVETETTNSFASAGPTLLNAVAFVIRGALGAKRLCNQSANAATFSIGGTTIVRFENLTFTNSNGTKTSANALSKAGSSTAVVVAADCIFGDGTNALRAGINQNGGSINLRVIDCKFKSCTVAGVNITGTANALIAGCEFAANAADITSTAAILECFDNLFWGSTSGDAVNSSGQQVVFCGNTVHDATGDGLECSHATPVATILANNFTANGGYGVNLSSGSLVSSLVNENYNNFGTGGLANASGAVNGISAGADSLTVDPGYTNAAGGNFAVGTNVQAKGFPLAPRTVGANDGATVSYVDIGAAQRQETGGAADYPSEDDVRDGVTFDSGGQTGNLVLPAEADVEDGVMYGTDGTEFEGELVVGGGGLLLGSNKRGGMQ